MTKQKRPEVQDDPDMRGVMPALMRARKRAHKIAHQTGTKIVVVKDGKMMFLDPDPALYEDDALKDKAKEVARD